MAQVAKAMVTQCGFDKGLGQVAWQQQQQQTFVGQQMGQAPNCSAHTADQIDAAVKAIVDKAYRCGTVCGYCKGQIAELLDADGRLPHS